MQEVKTLNDLEEFSGALDGMSGCTIVIMRYNEFVTTGTLCNNHVATNGQGVIRLVENKETRRYMLVTMHGGYKDEWEHYNGCVLWSFIHRTDTHDSGGGIAIARGHYLNEARARALMSAGVHTIIALKRSICTAST